MPLFIVHDGLGGFVGTAKPLEGMAHGSRVHSFSFGLLSFQEGQDQKISEIISFIHIFHFHVIMDVFSSGKMGL